MGDEDTTEPLYIGPEHKRMDAKPLWEDVTNGILIPQALANPGTFHKSTHQCTYETEITPKQERWFLRLIGIDRLANDITTDVCYADSEGIEKDRYQIYSLLGYLSTYEPESRPIRLKYHGHKGQWKLGIRELWSYFDDWSGCIITTPGGRDYFDSDDYPGRPTGRSEGLIYEPDSAEARKMVELACEQRKGEFMESLGRWIQELLTSSIESRMGTRSPRRMSANSLKNLKHQH